jgi:hypothetical protein
MFLNPSIGARYIEAFNHNDEETIIQLVSNAGAWAWLVDNMPLFECPDPQIEETYYFRWWVYRKHIKQTPDGPILTEFHPDVPWAGKYNAINGSAGHHLYEGRWLANRETFLNSYAEFWFRKGGSLRSYSAWLADAIFNTCKVSGDFSQALDLLPDFVENYRSWEAEHQHASGLFWSVDDRDAMEFSISGSGLRPTLNSYMYADAMAIAQIARLAGQSDLEQCFLEKAQNLKRLVEELLWDEKAQFFKTIPLMTKDMPVTSWDFRLLDPDHNVREQVGFIPWAYQLPGPGYERAWEQLIDTNGFAAPFGPTTAEQRHPRFMFRHDAHECLWNGPSWPFATSQTLMGMANALSNGGGQSFIRREDYLSLLKTYASCHYRTLPDGRKVNWLDENLDPFTGEWLSRRILEQWGWRADKGGRERGKDYNHSSFCDLIINGLIGLKPSVQPKFEVRPLVPEGFWPYFCLDNVSYHGKRLTILYDADGSRYHQGNGLHVFVNQRLAASGEDLSPLAVDL